MAPKKSASEQVPGKKKADEKKSARPRPAPAPAPGDDPIAVLSAQHGIGYDYIFDAAQLKQAVADGPTAESAAEVLVSEVTAEMIDDSIARLRALDPNFPAVLVRAVLAVAGTCPDDEVRAALAACRDRPRSLAARFTRVSLARRLPGHWVQDALEVARALISVAIKNMDTDLFVALFPPPPVAVDPVEPTPVSGPGGATPPNPIGPDDAGPASSPSPQGG